MVLLSYDKPLCYFEFEASNVMEEKEVSVRICVDSSDILHCFDGEKELRKHSLFCHDNPLCEYYSLQGSVKETMEMLQDLEKIAEKANVPLWQVMDKLLEGSTEPSMLVRALYNMKEQERFEKKRRQVSSMRNDIDVFTTRARTEGVNLKRIQDRFAVIRSRFFSGKAEESTVNETVAKLNDLKK